MADMDNLAINGGPKAVARKLAGWPSFDEHAIRTDSVDAETNARLPQVDPDGVQELKLPTAEQMTLRRLASCAKMGGIARTQPLQGGRSWTGEQSWHC